MSKIDEQNYNLNLISSLATLLTMEIGISYKGKMEEVLYMKPELHDAELLLREEGKLISPSLNHVNKLLEAAHKEHGANWF